MSVEMVIELSNQQAAETVARALEQYKSQLRASIGRTRRRLADFETRHEVTTAHFLTAMTADDLAGGDLEYVDWAGEAKLLEGLEVELRELEDARLRLR
jgi:hypothetical protein